MLRFRVITGGVCQYSICNPDESVITDWTDIDLYDTPDQVLYFLRRQINRPDVQVVPHT